MKCDQNDNVFPMAVNLAYTLNKMAFSKPITAPWPPYIAANLQQPYLRRRLVNRIYEFRSYRQVTFSIILKQHQAVILGGRGSSTEKLGSGGQLVRTPTSTVSSWTPTCHQSQTDIRLPALLSLRSSDTPFSHTIISQGNEMNDEKSRPISRRPPLSVARLPQ